MYQHLTHSTGDDLGTASEWWAAMGPIHDRIPGVLIQFPARFHHTPTAADRLQELASAIDAPAFVEVKHASWHTPAGGDVLRELDAVPVCLVDDALPITPHDHPKTGVVRLIGSRLDKGMHGALRHDRRPAMKGLAKRIRERSWTDCHVVMTNHYEGSGPLSIERFAQELDVAAPDRSRAGRSRGQASLF